MPAETDPERLKLLVRLLLGGVGHVEFTPAALTGKPTDADSAGLYGVFGSDVSRAELKVQLREAVVAFLRQNGKVTRVDKPGDRGTQMDPATFYEFRIELAGTRVYVETILSLDEPDDPELLVLKVKKGWR